MTTRVRDTGPDPDARCEHGVLIYEDDGFCQTCYNIAMDLRADCHGDEHPHSYMCEAAPKQDAERCKHGELIVGSDGYCEYCYFDAVYARARCHGDEHPHRAGCEPIMVGASQSKKVV